VRSVIGMVLNISLPLQKRLNKTFMSIVKATT
jgi:hypothetical protein